jgi:hypothetical protein
MSTITSLTGSDGITTANSMAKINTNFSNLNTDKIETSTLDTDTTLAANSDSKIATQKAVKAYVDSGGNPNASTTQAGIVQEASQAQVDAGTAAGSTAARLFLNPSTVSASETTAGLVEEATDAEVAAGTATGGTTRKLFVTPAKLAKRFPIQTLVKTADETVNNSNVLQNDDVILFTVEASKLYSVELIVHYNSGSTPDFKWAFSVPSGTTFIGKELQDADRVTQVTESGNNPIGTGANKTLVIKGTIISSSTAGTVNWKWAQDTTNASDTKVLIGTYIKVEKLN